MKDEGGRMKNGKDSVRDAKNRCSVPEEHGQVKTSAALETIRTGSTPLTISGFSEGSVTR
jgi:hypothetical protein